MSYLLCRTLQSYDHRIHAQIHRRYGPAPLNADSAINILVDVVRDQSGKKYTMDHYQTRFPTNVLDIAGFLVRLASMNSSLFSSIIPGLTRTTLFFRIFPYSRARETQKRRAAPDNTLLN
jgi:hypothetical protein